MESNLKLLKSKFLEKQQLLEKANKKLKEEFFGIDPIIDNIIKSVSSWYVLSDIQETPLIINLWGLTGVGKTSLITRLVELLDVKDQFFKFDLGNKGFRQSFATAFHDLCENMDSSDAIIVLDEFQHARTVKGPEREEVDNSYNESLWQLIDSGKVHYMSWRRSVYDFYEYVVKLSKILSKGVVVENGKIVSGNSLFLSEFEHRKNEKKPLYFVSDQACESILKFAPKEMSLHLMEDVRRKLNQLDGATTIEFLFKVYKNSIRPEVKDFSKSLIFVIGNLDEAYSMSGNFNADLDADNFHDYSKKITLPKIKQALRERFRDEQIARLGNIHMIYPALSSKAYQQIIKNQLFTVSRNLTTLTGLKVVFDESVELLIYKEGVFPTQGVRPIMTSINHLIKSNLTDFIVEVIKKDSSIDLLKFHFRGRSLICKFCNQGKELYEKRTDLVTNLEALRRSKRDDLQSITAVHESGHAILSAILLNTIPEVVRSVTSDANSDGFVFSKFAWNYISKKELIPRVAMDLGGYAAEELIFGKEHVTAGASSDIKKATIFVSNMIKNEGMGSQVISVNIPQSSNNYRYNNYESAEEEIRKVMEQGLELARETLQTEKQLLLKLSDYLSDCNMIKKEDLKNMIEEFATIKPKCLTSGKNIFYRKHLKDAVNSFGYENTLSIVNKTASNR